MPAKQDGIEQRVSDIEHLWQVYEERRALEALTHDLKNKEIKEKLDDIMQLLTPLQHLHGTAEEISSDFAYLRRLRKVHEEMSKGIRNIGMITVLGALISAAWAGIRAAINAGATTP